MNDVRDGDRDMQRSSKYQSNGTQSGGLAYVPSFGRSAGVTTIHKHKL